MLRVAIHGNYITLLIQTCQSIWEVRNSEILCLDISATVERRKNSPGVEFSLLSSKGYLKLGNINRCLKYTGRRMGFEESLRKGWMGVENQ